ncbi:hypothetical protein J0383_00740 [Flavobacterium endoglycinae]|uniref:Uncharacterized protein n=1 Tax=Flavobacterium endoglycinae TaxID=2816357 RepID=A0ABX7QFK8_9FLAO|nr:hypothetical protein [Flavobacterium endoglycinae]QSW89356.1 hypothetical protein J0383_00740 [Flavobacterium endoglycinae]
MEPYQKKTALSNSEVTAANASNTNSASVQLKDNRPESVAQFTKVHHNPTKKKYIPKALGKKQVADSAAALAIKKASPVPISNKEARRQAQGK